MPFVKTPYIWQNGNWVSWDEATVHVTAHALHYGSSVFEGLRAYATPNGPAVLCLAAHVQRMFNSAKIIRMPLPYSPQELQAAVLELIDRNKHQSCYIRPLAFRGSEALGLNARSCPVEVVIFTMEWGRYLGAEAIENGVEVMISSWRRMAPDTLPALAKVGGQYVNSQLIAMEAAENGFQEGIALDVNGYVSEGAGENVFVVLDGALYTPPLASSILGGITRRCVLQMAEEMGVPVREQTLSREMLYVADEMFFTGTAAEITPVRSVDRVPVGAGTRGPVTRRLQERFFGITSGQLPDTFKWMTPVRESHASIGLVRSFEGR